MTNILKITTLLLFISFCLYICDASARGGFSGGGRGGFSSARSFSSPSRSYSSPSRITTTTTSRSSYSGHYYSGMGYHPMMYPGFGMGYGYYGNNGLLTGLIIGSMMHPQGTTIYSGGGYSGSALLYPDGRVVDQNGYQVGTYINGQFSALSGGMVAQAAPPDAVQQMQQPQQSSLSGWEIAGGIIVGILVVALIIAILS